ncbi:flagellar motor protein MotB [Marinobacter nanhaiticus D15-8W]|uniref:Type VI secretion system protein TssL n=1 Tax=Marinobacter nanhaiticus D15-8W TaxID=626887 RepID=N6WNA9_9GAMM|nr:flagellar motor protein MotB [Marinobacter nanhaiticus]ENO12542.1 type VI secretion system protein TssL [Marinobacter nanhaiticus D15-8W]BES69879.1 flagellar motor protein MotB [Marinobacter nanhaiticus D15-8W]
MDELPEEEQPGVPAWVVTFADLMSLLMCFFVLLLSFAEIDANKFKQIADELSKAFGVQRDVPALEIPMGTSPVFDHFSAAKPEPTVINEVRQETSREEPVLETNTTQSEIETQLTEAREQEAQRHLETLEKVLQEELETGKLDLRKDSDRIVIRIEEKGSFPSGSATLTYAFEDMLYRMAEVLKNIPGDLTIEGHTDDIPIRSSRYDSNWNLSADRAAAVANVLIEGGGIDPKRVRVQGFAATQPRVSNDTPANRALNRRVEIIVDLSESHAETRVRLQDLMEQTGGGISPTLEDAPSPSDSLDW